MSNQQFSLRMYNKHSDYVIHWLYDGDVIIERKDIWQDKDSAPFVYWKNAWARAFNGLPIPDVDDLTLEKNSTPPIHNPALAALVCQAQRELEQAQEI